MKKKKADLMLLDRLLLQLARHDQLDIFYFPVSKERVIFLDIGSHNQVYQFRFLPKEKSSDIALRLELLFLTLFTAFAKLVIENMLKTNLKIYLDTSVISAYFDKRQIDRLKLTRLAWSKIKKAKIFISEITLRELNNATDSQKQREFKQFIKGFNVLPLNDEAKNLARLYKKAGIMPNKFQDDIYQLAIATIFNMDYVLSWNFKHMVNISVRAAVDAANVQSGYGHIDILAPAEML